jgi:hypothetical protein
LKVAGARRQEELRLAGAAGRVEVTVGQVWGKTEARRLAARTEVLESAPAMDAALADGSISAAHVDGLLAAAKQVPEVLAHERDLAAAARNLAPDEFAQMCKRRAALADPSGGVTTLQRQRAQSKVKRWIDPYSGMYRLEAHLDPERGARVWAALDKGIEDHFHHGHDSSLTNDQRAAAVLHDMITSGAKGTTGAVVHVHIDLETLQHGLRADSTIRVTGGGSMSVDTIRRIACEADIIPYVLNSHGVVVDVGRSKRLATWQQRNALAAMYPTCAIPGCAVAFTHTRIHHIRPFETGGTTDLANLLPVCEQHHHDVHEGRWRLHLHPTTRDLTITRPDGTTAHAPLLGKAG